jgi:replicative DNA helicase
VDNVPTAANIQYYAKIVKKRPSFAADPASSEIIAYSYEAKRDVDELWKVK